MKHSTVTVAEEQTVDTCAQNIQQFENDILVLASCFSGCAGSVTARVHAWDMDYYITMKQF